MPARPLTNYDLTKKLKTVDSFVGVFMRDELLQRYRKVKECGIINLNTTSEPGSHWVAYIVNRNKAIYFDAFGNLRPPLELIKYLGTDTQVLYNLTQYQPFNTIICGHLCLTFIFLMNANN